MTIPVLR